MRNKESERKRAWLLRQPEYLRCRNLRLNYGLTPDQYSALLSRQAGVCAACRKPETAWSKRANRLKMLSVDHNHKTGKVRGLLCSACNSALGYAREDPERLVGLARYIWMARETV